VYVCLFCLFVCLFVCVCLFVLFCLFVCLYVCVISLSEACFHLVKGFFFFFLVKHEFVALFSLPRQKG